MNVEEAIATLEELAPTSDEFRTILAKLLRRIDPFKPFGADLFDSLARLSISEAFEGVLLREYDGRLEVYMTTRSKDDTAYPSECHIPGSIFRPGESEADVVARLGRREFGCQIKKWSQVASVRFMEVRGSFHSLIYLIEVEGEPKNARGGWYSVDELPANTVAHHAQSVIPLAVAAHHLL